MSEPMKYLFGQYFQKSLNYLFPLTGICMSRSDAILPAGTFLWWEDGEESIDDMKLIVVFSGRNPDIFGPFEKNTLLKNPNVEACYNIDSGTAYIVDMSKHRQTVEHFLDGKYSKFSDSVKRRILTYHNASLDKIIRPGRYLHMSLYPELYWEQVSKELHNYPVESLREVGELANVYNREKETLKEKNLGKCLKTPKKTLSLPDK